MKIEINRGKMQGEYLNTENGNNFLQIKLENMFKNSKYYHELDVNGKILNSNKLNFHKTSLI